MGRLQKSRTNRHKSEKWWIYIGATFMSTILLTLKILNYGFPKSITFFICIKLNIVLFNFSSSFYLLYNLYLKHCNICKLLIGIQLFIVEIIKTLSQWYFIN